MGGPTEQTTNTVFIPPGEGRQTFAPLPLAWLVENLEVGPDGVLESVVGPSILRIKSELFVTTDSDGFEGKNYPMSDVIRDSWPIDTTEFGLKNGEPFSVFSAPLLNGSARILLYRIGSRMFIFNGGQDNPDDVLITGLTVDPSSKNLDQYVVLNDMIIYFNGSDTPQVITYDGTATQLGFDQRASAPSISSPSQPDYDDTPNYYPNSMGYSWQGRIGTPGDELAGQKASLLKGSWYYYFQYEDINGNLSEFSLPSDPATIHTNQAEPFLPPEIQTTADGTTNIFGGGKPRGKKTFPMGAEIDDLTRRFLVKAPGDLPEHAVATRIFRTPDTYHKDPTPKLVARVPGSKQFYFDDNNSDSDLGSSWTETVSVPVFRVACAHQGRLVIGNVPGAPGIVRQSQPGFPGTFEKDAYIYPDSNGAEITALASHNGNLIAFTESSTYLIGNDFMQPQPLSLGIGCVAPKSVQSLRNGSLVWLGSDGVYSLDLSGGIQKISAPLDKVFDQELNKSQFFRAASVIDYETGEYRCVLASKGFPRNDIMLCFDGVYWRRQTLGIQIADMCTLADHTHVTVAVGADPREQLLKTTLVDFGGGYTVKANVNLSRVFILNKQSTDYFGPPRRIRYRSAWIRASEFGLVPTNVRNLYVGMMDAWVGSATIRLYRNGSWEPISVMQDLLLHGPDDESGIIADVASEAVVGAARTRDPRIFWRQIPVDIQNANSWAFEIEILGSPSPTVPDLTDASYKLSEQSVWEALFSDPKIGLDEFERRSKDLKSWELGRLKIAAFAFDTSIATKGAPLGRVPFRQDK